MTDLTLRERILKIRDWRHPYQLLDGTDLPLAADWYAEWHRWRASIDRASIDALFGGLEGVRILDLGCNDGFYGFECLKQGARELVGVDARDDHVQRATLLRDYFGVQNATFLRGDVDTLKVDVPTLGLFDVTLCHGLLYHLTNPIGALRSVADHTRTLLCMQTSTSDDEGAVLRLHQEDVERPGSGIFPLVCIPSRGAVVTMLRHAGFVRILEATPQQRFAGPPESSDFVRRWRFYYALRTADSTAVSSEVDVRDESVVLTEL